MKGYNLKKKDIEIRVLELVNPIIKKNEVELIEIEYVKEGNEYFLRIYIDKKGGLSINDCENVSRELDKYLDEEDFIESAYHLEVSSPGLTRTLKTEADFIRYSGELVEVKLYKKFNEKKAYEGELIGLINGEVVILYDNNQLNFNYDDIANVKRVIRF
jgi:ribosome maturation factor RimP